MSGMCYSFKRPSTQELIHNCIQLDKPLEKLPKTIAPKKYLKTVEYMANGRSDFILQNSQGDYFHSQGIDLSRLVQSSNQGLPKNHEALFKEYHAVSELLLAKAGLDKHVLVKIDGESYTMLDLDFPDINREKAQQSLIREACTQPITKLKIPQTIKREDENILQYCRRQISIAYQIPRVDALIIARNYYRQLEINGASHPELSLITFCQGENLPAKLDHEIDRCEDIPKSTDPDDARAIEAD